MTYLTRRRTIRRVLRKLFRSQSKPVLYLAESPRCWFMEKVPKIRCLEKFWRRLSVALRMIVFHLQR